MFPLVSVLLFQVMALSYEMSGAAMRGMGHSTLPAVITVIGTCFLRIAWIFTVFAQFRTFEMLLYIYPISWAITGTAVLIAYFIVRRREEKRVAVYSLLQVDL